MTDALNQLIAEMEARYQPGAANAKVAARVERFQRNLLEKNQRTSSGPVEIKELEVKHNGHLTFVTIVIGRVEENDAARLFLRDHRHLMIGPRGGVTLLNARTRGHREGWLNALLSLTLY